MKRKKRFELNTRRPAVNLTRLLRVGNQQSKACAPFLTFPEDLLIRPDAQINVSMRENGDLIATSVPPTPNFGNDFADGFVV